MDSIRTVEPSELIELGFLLNQELGSYFSSSETDISKPIASLVAKNEPLKIVAEQKLPCWSTTFKMDQIGTFLQASGCILGGSGAVWLFREYLRKILGENKKDLNPGVAQALPLLNTSPFQEVDPADMDIFLPRGTCPWETLELFLLHVPMEKEKRRRGAPESLEPEVTVKKLGNSMLKMIYLHTQIEFVSHEYSSPIHGSLNSDLENCCVCWNGKEFFFSTLCLYAQFSNTIFISLEPRLRTSSRIDRYRRTFPQIQFYPGQELSYRNEDDDDPDGYATRPPQPLMTPFCTELHTTPSELVILVQDLKKGELSGDAKQIIMKSMIGHGIAGDNEPAENASMYPKSHYIPVVGWQLLKKFAKTETNEGLFDAMMALDTQTNTSKSIEATLYFEPYVLPVDHIDLRILTAHEDAVFGEYPPALFEAATPQIMRFMPPNDSEVLILSMLALMEDLGKDICRVIALKIYSVTVHGLRQERIEADAKRRQQQAFGKPTRNAWRAPALPVMNHHQAPYQQAGGFPHLPWSDDTVEDLDNAEAWGTDGDPEREVLENVM